MTIFFTPSAEHSVPRTSGKHYALFVPTGKGANCVRSPLPNSGKGVPIRVKFHLPELIAVAIQRTLVDVEVTKGRSDSRWTLHALTIPAAGKEK